jgi:hypothetical protein
MRPELGPEFIVASDVEAAVRAESIPLDGVNCVAVDPEGLYGLDEYALARLQCMVLGCKYTSRVIYGYKQVYIWDELHGPWLMRLPDQFVAALAAADLRSKRTTAREWAKKCDAFQDNAAPQSWVEQTLEQLVQLARRAVQQKEKMYWVYPSC